MIIKLNTIVVLLKDRGASMGDAKRRCIGCMREFDADIHVCPYCGFDDETPIAKDYLKPRTFLHDRYLVGKPLRYNGEGISYIGYDYSVDSVVEIREYFPDQLCFRAEDGSQNLVIQPGCETKFKTFLIDRLSRPIRFLKKTIQHMRCGSMWKALHLHSIFRKTQGNLIGRKYTNCSSLCWKILLSCMDIKFYIAAFLRIRFV